MVMSSTILEIFIQLVDQKINDITVFDKDDRRLLEHLKTCRLELIMFADDHNISLAKSNIKTQIISRKNPANRKQKTISKTNNNRRQLS